MGATLEEAIIAQLSVGVCGDVLMGSGRLGLGRVEASARGLALERFEEVAGTAGFMRMDEELVSSLLEDDGLRVSKEEVAFEALVGWMKVGGCGLRGRGMLQKIRFGLMDQEYLTSQVHKKLGAEYAEWIHGLVVVALSSPAGGEGPGAKELAPRIGWGVRWEQCGDGAGRRLKGHADDVYALAECEGRMCSGTFGGSIRVWNSTSLEPERNLYESEYDTVYCLTTWNGLLISGHIDGRILVWNVVTGENVVELQGHTEPTNVLAVSGSRLASGSWDKSVKVWAMGAGAAWPCERTLVGYEDLLNVLATWRDKVISGSNDHTIRVCDMGTGVHDATLTGHDGAVDGLVVHGDRLLSASEDGTIREWAVGTWVALRMVEVYEQSEVVGKSLCCLAVSGSKLVCGCDNDDDDAACEVRVLDLRTLACEHTLVQPAGAKVCCLAAVKGEVWGGVGDEVVVWGRAFVFPGICFGRCIFRAYGLAFFVWPTFGVLVGHMGHQPDFDASRSHPIWRAKRRRRKPFLDEWRYSGPLQFKLALQPLGDHWICGDCSAGHDFGHWQNSLGSFCTGCDSKPAHGFLHGRQYCTR